MPRPLDAPNRVMVVLLSLAAICGCERQPRSVVVYCSVDEEFAARVLSEFAQRTGVAVQPVYDSEAGKTTGLVNRIRAERDHPRADVLFSSEVFNTIALADEGLLAAHDWSTAADVSPAFRDPGGRWVAIGLRGRVLAFDPQRTKREDLPVRWEQLAEPRYASRLALANPLFGTTKGHVAAMFAAWGADRATAFLQALREHGALMVDGNSAAVRAVLDGRADWCMTDTDDVWVARRDGAGIDLVYPDMGDGSTLWIPCTVALTHRRPIDPDVRRLADFLVSAETERLLAASRSRNVPVRPSLRASLDVGGAVVGGVSYVDIAAALEPSTQAVRDILLQ